MDVLENSNKLSAKNLFLFIAVLFFAFLPISSFLFFLKNDAFINYFPPKFFMSESIHAGYLPLWNPYLNFGFPQYGDMSAGYWSPITWLIASTVGYNAYTFTLEVMCYIFLGGIGMYQLTGAWQLNKKVRIIAGIAFMCCGYNVGHLQHFNWLSGAAFLPWCFWSYLILLNRFTIKNTLRAVMLFYMLAASAHPGITFASFYFFAGILVFHLYRKEGDLSLMKRVKKASLTHVFFGLLLVLLSAGMISGYMDIIPHFLRGEKISLNNSLLHPANIQTWISALLPFATVKNDAFYNTDPSMRNSYFSGALLLFFLVACINKKSGWQKFLLLTGSLFALLSAGSIFKTFAYKFLPLIGFVRLNGEFRIFALLCFIIIAAIELDKFISRKNDFAGAVKWVYYIIEMVLITCIVTGLYFAIHSKLSLVYGFNNIMQQNTIALKLKALVDAVSFYDSFWIQGSVQLFLWWGIKWCLKFGNINLLMKIVVADLIIASMMNIPFTGAGKASVAHVQSLLNRSPNGIPIPVLQPIKNIDTSSTEDKGVIGDWSMYNKQIGVVSEVAYPIILKNMNAYFLNDEQHPGSNFLLRPFVFIKDENIKTSLSIEKFSPNKIEVTATAESATQIVLQQNFYPHWFYQNGGNKTAVMQEGINFMGGVVNKGQSKIVFSFEPAAVKWAMLLSAILFVIYCLLLFIISFKSLFHLWWQKLSDY